MPEPESSGGEFGGGQGLHHSPAEAAEALDRLFRLHNGDLSALMPELDIHKHFRGGIYEAISMASASRNTTYPQMHIMMGPQDPAAPDR
jgi:hypothetical protein